MKKIFILCGFLLSFNAFADEKDGIEPLGKEPTEEQMQVVRDAARDSCEEKEDDAREECVMDYYAQHNLDEEPSCD